MCGNWQVFLILQCFLFFIVICFVTYWLIYLFIYFLLCINVVNLLSTIKKNVWNHVRSVYFSDGGSRDRDIIFIDRRYLVFCFLGCVVKFQAREANSRRRGTSSNPCNWVCVLFLFLSFRFFFFFLPTFSIFFQEQTHTGAHTIKGGAERRGTAEWRHWRAVCFTRFVDYRLMFDSGLSFSLEYNLIRLPY